MIRLAQGAADDAALLGAFRKADIQVGSWIGAYGFDP